MTGFAKNACAATIAVMLLSTSQAWGAADLVPTAFAPPATMYAGETAVVSFTVQNQGDAATSTSAWADKVLLSADMVLGGDTEIGNVSRFAALAASASYTQNISIGVSSATAPGSYYLLFLTDTNNNVPESNETNNMYAAQPVTITKSDLVPTAFAPPTTMYAGETAVVFLATVPATTQAAMLQR